jgi:hypothetical protein
MRITAMLITTAMLAACATGLKPGQWQGPGTALSVAREAGCSSGKAAGGNPYFSFTKDTEQYITDVRYKSDWDDGFALCKGQMDAVNSVPLR